MESATGMTWEAEGRGTVGDLLSHAVVTPAEGDRKGLYFLIARSFRRFARRYTARRSPLERVESMMSSGGEGGEESEGDQTEA